MLISLRTPNPLHESFLNRINQRADQARRQTLTQPQQDPASEPPQQCEDPEPERVPQQAKAAEADDWLQQLEDHHGETYSA